MGLPLLVWGAVTGANFAQVSGPKLQNLASVKKPPWTDRWGFATCALDYNDLKQKETGQNARMFIFGGDDFNDVKGGGGFRNDVYQTLGKDWATHEHPLMFNKRNAYDSRLVSRTRWTLVNQGKKPPPGISYEYWITCMADNAPWRKPSNLEDCNPALWPQVRNQWTCGCETVQEPPGMYQQDSMWSPRRNMGAVAMDTEIFILGGRARVHMDLSESETMGGLTGSVVGRGGRFDTTEGHVWREKTELKNDVWSSKDGGKTWSLSNPGCRHASTQNNTRKGGGRDIQCFQNSDCYGDARCETPIGAPPGGGGTCICNTFSPRESFASVVHDGFMYVIGGFVDRQLQNCGVESVSSHINRKSGEEYACGGGYRGYVADVWNSKDGKTWNQLNPKSPWKPRGEHVVFIMDDVLFIATGRTGHSWDANSEEFLGDMWFSNERGRISNALGETWEKWLPCDDVMSDPMACGPSPEFSPRSNAAAVVLPRSPKRRFDKVFLMGGQGGLVGNETYFNDVWTWEMTPDSKWEEDFNQNTSKVSTYIWEDAPLTMLNRDAPTDLITDEDVAVLKSKGISSIHDLANIPLDVVLQLRVGEWAARPALDGGGMVRQYPKIPSICHQKWLAAAVINRCTVKEDPIDLSDSELTDASLNLIRGNKNLKGLSGLESFYGDLLIVGNATHLADGPDSRKPELEVATAGGAGGFQFNNQGGAQYDRKVESGLVVLDEVMDQWELKVADWDGCEPIGSTEFDPETGQSVYADIDGNPQQQIDSRNVKYKEAVWRIEEELLCRWIWTPRISHKAIVFQEDVYVLAGRQADGNGTSSMWYRDDVLPTVTFTLVPKDGSSQSNFSFLCSEDGCIFEYRINSWGSNEIICNWTKSGPWVDLLQADCLQAGIHRIRIRAIDPAGNHEAVYEEGRNQLTWEYVPPIPWMLILTIIGCVLAFMFGMFLEMKRRRRKAAMERYAIKRMRRKFKGVKKGDKGKDVDWKKYGKTAKKAAKDGKKKKKGSKKKSDGKEKKGHKKHGEKKHKHDNKHKHKTTHTHHDHKAGSKSKKGKKK